MDAAATRLKAAAVCAGVAGLFALASEVARRRRKPGALDASGRAAWVDQIAAKLREASKAVNGLLPSDPWSLVRVDHSATSCEGGACPRLRLREGARLSE